MVSTLKSFAKNALQYVHIYDKMVVIQKNRQAPARTIVFSMEGMNNRFSCLQISYAVLDPENDDVTSWHVPIRTEADAHPSCSFHLHLRRKKRTPWIISGIIMANYKGNGSNSNLSRFINHATIGSKIIFTWSSPPWNTHLGYTVCSFYKSTSQKGLPAVRPKYICLKRWSNAPKHTVSGTH